MFPRKTLSLSLLWTAFVGVAACLSACGGDNSQPPACRRFASHYTAVTQSGSDPAVAGTPTTITTKGVFDRATVTLRNQNYSGDASTVDPMLLSTFATIWETIDQAVASNRPIGKDTSVRTVLNSPASANMTTTADCTLTFEKHYDSMGRPTETVGSPHVDGCSYAVSTVYREWDAMGRPTKGIYSSAGSCLQQPITRVYDDQALTVTTTYEEAPSCTTATVVNAYDADGLLISYSRKTMTSTITTIYTTLETSEICP
ncbi:MAG TPA: hypothetical protein VNG73_08375 [Gemmatimonadaceae bacterium]|nr:hypothetical protein [Gemmatimonadaceae bacterium]